MAIPLLAELLHGCWRPQPDPPSLSLHHLDALTPVLVGSGAGPASWRQIRASALAATPAGAFLHDLYRGQALRQALDESHIVRIIQELRDAGIEPVIWKGWAAARLYADPTIRPYGDLDLCVSPSQLAPAEAIVRSPHNLPMAVDLEHADPVGVGTWEELFARTRHVPLGTTSVRVLGPEDQMRALCLHFLRHGAWRPLWLCDIAAALETRPPEFDWDLCLGPDPHRAEGMVAVLQLAAYFLGADLTGAPIPGGTGSLPPWFLSAVLTRWHAPLPGLQPPHTYGPPLRQVLLRRPRQLPAALVRRWPDPVTATAAVNGAWFHGARFPLQLKYLIRRFYAFARSLFPPSPAAW